MVPAAASGLAGARPMLPSALAMWTRSARACALAALAIAVMPATPAGAQGLSDLLENLTGGASTSTTPAPTTTAPAETAPAAPVDPAPAPVDPAAAPVDPAAAGATPAPPAAEQPPAGVTEEPITAATKEDRGSTAVPAVLAVLAVVLLLGAAAWALARWLSFDPRWMQRWRHASREAAYRASGMWADFSDWVRLGR